MNVRVVGIIVVVIVVITVRGTRMRGRWLGAMAVGWWRRFVSLTFVLAHGTAEMIVAACKLKETIRIGSQLFNRHQKIKRVEFDSFTYIT